MSWYTRAKLRMQDPKWDEFLGKKTPKPKSTLSPEQAVMLDNTPVGEKENQFAVDTQKNETLRNQLGIGQKDIAEKMRKNRGLIPLYKTRQRTWVTRPMQKVPDTKPPLPRYQPLKDPNKRYTQNGVALPYPNTPVQTEAYDIAYEMNQSGKLDGTSAAAYREWLAPLVPSPRQKNDPSIASKWEQYKAQFMSGEISKDQLSTWRYEKAASGGWYAKLRKLAYPYGRLKCPSCAKTFVDDFGFKDVSGTGNSQGNTSTQELGGTPFIDFEEKQYAEPIDGVEKDQVERGTVVAQCPNCKQWAEVEYEWDTSSPEAANPDFFSQVKVTDVQPITEEMAQAYKQVGMSNSFAIEDSEPPKYDDVLTDPMEQPVMA